MQPAASSSFRHPNPQIRKELVELLYTSFPQVAAISGTSVMGAIAMAAIAGDTGYAIIAFLILITATARLCSLHLYKSRAAQFSDSDVIRWERIYGIGSATFGTALGMLSYRALHLDDAPGAWLAFGLSMSFCVAWCRVRPFALGWSC